MSVVSHESSPNQTGTRLRASCRWDAIWPGLGHECPRYRNLAALTPMAWRLHYRGSVLYKPPTIYSLSRSSFVPISHAAVSGRIR